MVARLIPLAPRKGTMALPDLPYEDEEATMQLVDAIVFGDGIEWTNGKWRPKTIVVRRSLVRPIDTEDMTIEEIESLADYKAQVEEDNYRDRD